MNDAIDSREVKISVFSNSNFIWHSILLNKPEDSEKKKLEKRNSNFFLVFILVFAVFNIE